MSVLELKHPSIADIPEGELVDLLLSDPTRRSDMFEIFGMPREASWKTRIQLAQAPGNIHSDVDVLLCDPAKPEEAVAYEVKRIKFGMRALREGGKPNKLGELKKAVKQANQLATIGFWKVFLYIIVVVDSREQNAGETTYQGLRMPAQSLLESEMKVQGLEPRVGFSVLDFTQPMDHEPLTVGTHGMHIRRMPTSVAQGASLTKWVAAVFSKM